MLLWDQVNNSIQQNSWPWVITGGIVAALFIGFIFRYRRRIAIVSQTLNRANKMVALDGAVLRMLSHSKTPDEYKRVLVETLRHITLVFDEDVERAAILLPDVTDTSSLICWEHYQMPEDSIKSKRIYIGNDPQMQREKGGVASEAFRNGRIMVCHKENGHWTYEGQAQPIDLVQGAHPYLSFVCVPIMGSNAGTNTTVCIGIMHLESRRKDTFDSSEIKIVLEELTRGVATTILISERHP